MQSDEVREKGGVKGGVGREGKGRGHFKNRLTNVYFS